MNDVQHRMKNRLGIMMVANGGAVAGAGPSFLFYLRSGQKWALLTFAASLALGFIAQIWFIAGLRRSGKGT